jgi:excisionase family DNA binding protein
VNPTSACGYNHDVALEISRYVLSRPAEEKPKQAPARRRQPSVDRKHLLSKREAARRLGIDRGSTLQALIDSGKIQTVRLAGRERIPVAEIERLSRPESRQAKRQAEPRAKRPPSGAGARIRALKIT